MRGTPGNSILKLHQASFNPANNYFSRLLHGNFMQIHTASEIKAPLNGCFNGRGEFNFGQVMSIKRAAN